jgi:hypothetical protein
LGKIEDSDRRRKRRLDLDVGAAASRIIWTPAASGRKLDHSRNAIGIESFQNGIE